MKKISTIIIVVITLLVIPASCEIEKNPFYAIEESESYKTIQDAKAFNNGLYTFLRNRSGGLFLEARDIQADIFNASSDFGNRMGTVYRWDFTSADYTIGDDTWQPYYSAISKLNSFLDNVNKIRPTNAADEALLNKYKGEAYFVRAFYYHKLVKNHAKDYEPATASTDLGLPMVLHFDVEQKPSRSTVEETYKQITADIAEAKKLIVTAGKAGSERITKDCVTALEARVLLDMHKYTEAAAAADTLINSNTYPLVSTAADFKKIWYNDNPAESILQLYAAKSTEAPPSTGSRYLGYSAGTGRYVPDFIPQQWVVDLYDTADIRANVYLAKLPVRLNTIDTSVYLVNKYPGNPELFTGATTNYQHKPKIFRIAEMYLIKAEAHAWNNDDANALAALNELRTKRGLNALTGITGENLKNAIKEERLREMLCEGSRLDDLKRWNDDCVRKAPQNASIITTGTDSDKLIRQAGHDKFVWAIPANEINTNPNLKGQQNPGWDN
ncbi:MAG: RagB/SusD family nutrient uptake outer membrane protein [Prevotellaceae bacterium]|jgi:hypothetical protein|nr:RagB/SusD family nutrient uptake outer membrane protein [Prevotellaceae bacterium]